jgi:hypothetical protein
LQQRPGLDAGLGVDMAAGFIDRLGLNVPAGLKDVAAAIVAVAAMPQVPRIATVALCVGGGHGAADQLDQLQVERCDEEVDRGFEPQRPVESNPRGARSPLGRNRAEVEAKSGEIKILFSDAGQESWVDG